MPEQDRAERSDDAVENWLARHERVLDMALFCCSSSGAFFMIVVFGDVLRGHEPPWGIGETILWWVAFVVLVSASLYDRRLPLYRKILSPSRRTKSTIGLMLGIPAVVWGVWSLTQAGWPPLYLWTLGLLALLCAPVLYYNDSITNPPE